ncbi:MAG: hypothetical protein IPL74_05675 [Bacteroidetes bacterium]|nr:hypothetical protein [Bacteroidota bacterium]
MDGGYILGGGSNSNISGDKTENSLGLSDYWIIKTDDTGNILFQNTIGGSDADNNTSIQETLDGGFICAGLSISNISGDKTENCLGSSDFWILKIDSLGSIQWQNTIGGNGNHDPVSIFQTNDGGFMVWWLFSVKYIR